LLPSDLLHNLGDGSCAHRVAAFADREPQSLLHCHRRDQLDRQAYVVTRHDHLRPCRQLRYPRHVRGSQIKLRPVALDERRMPPPLCLRHSVACAFHFGWRGTPPPFAPPPPPLPFSLTHPAQHHPSTPPRHTFVQLLLEHLDAGHHRLARLAKPYDLHFLAHL